jgi:membrane fusion protein (multidrug efflux system)
VFTVRRGRAMRLALDAGFENPNHIEVRSGLEEGDEVVVLGQSGLKDRSPVKIVDPVMPSEDDTEEES